jgi:probable extracellular repeat, HAF family
MASRSPDGGGRSGISGWAQSLPLTYAVIDVPAQNGPPILSIGYAGGINNASQLVGSFAIIDANSAYVEHGFVYSRGSFTILDSPFPGLPQTAPRSINNLGEVVGNYFTDDGAPHGFLWSDGVFRAVRRAVRKVLH